MSESLFNWVADYMQLYQKRDSNTGIFLWIWLNFQEHLFHRTTPDGLFLYKVLPISFWNLCWTLKLRFYLGAPDCAGLLDTFITRLAGKSMPWQTYLKVISYFRRKLRLRCLTGLLTRWLRMTSILVIIQRIYRYQFKCNYLKNQKHFAAFLLHF